MPHQQFSHLTRTDYGHPRRGNVLEQLFRQPYRHSRHTHPPLSDRSQSINLLASGKRTMEQPVKYLACAFRLYRQPIALFYLCYDLRLAYHQAVQTRRYRQQMPGRLFIVMDIQKALKGFRFHFTNIADNPHQLVGVGNSVPPRSEINLRPVARGKQRKLGFGKLLLQLYKSFACLRTAKGELLPHRYRRCLMIQSYYSYFHFVLPIINPVLSRVIVKSPEQPRQIHPQQCYHYRRHSRYRPDTVEPRMSPATHITEMKIRKIHQPGSQRP